MELLLPAAAAAKNKNAYGMVRAQPALRFSLYYLYPESMGFNDYTTTRVEWPFWAT